MLIHSRNREISANSKRYNCTDAPILRIVKYFPKVIAANALLGDNKILNFNSSKK